jgi:hypothetical protein
MIATSPNLDMSKSAGCHEEQKPPGDAENGRHIVAGTMPSSKPRCLVHSGTAQPWAHHDSVANTTRPDPLSIIAPAGVRHLSFQWSTKPSCLLSAD